MYSRVLIPALAILALASIVRADGDKDPDPKKEEQKPKVEIERQLDLPDAKYLLIKAENKNKEAAPGHWIKLQGVARDANGKDISGKVKAWKWEIAGKVILTYTQTADKAEVTALTDLAKRTVNYYYISGAGDQNIKLTVTIDGKDFEGSDSITLKQPETVTLTTKTTGDAPATNGVAVSNPGFPGAGLELHYGLNTDPGITWTGKAKLPQVACPGVLDGRGELAFTQLVNALRNRIVTGQAPTQVSSGGKEVLDDALGIQYAGTDSYGAGAQGQRISSDTPGTPLAGLTMTNAHDRFRNFLMYKPGGSNSIWVSLSVVSWHWKGETVFAAGAWGAPTGTSSDKNPSGASTDAQPVWNGKVTSLGWVAPQ